MSGFLILSRKQITELRKAGAAKQIGVKVFSTVSGATYGVELIESKPIEKIEPQNWDSQKDGLFDFNQNGYSYKRKLINGLKPLDDVMKQMDENNFDECDNTFSTD